MRSRMSPALNRINIVPMVALLALLLFVCSCASSKPASPSLSLNGPVATESLDELLDRALLLTQVSYNMTYAIGGHQTMAAKIWFKGNLVRMDVDTGGISFVMIYDPGNSIQTNYLPSKQMASQKKIDPQKDDPNLAPSKLADEIKQGQPSLTGSEILDGKDCSVVNYVAKDSSKCKAWIWKAKGLLLKEVAQATQGEGVTEFKNISFVDIKDSLFSLPAGVRVVSEAEMNAALGTDSMQTPELNKKYANSTWGYSVKYPETWTLAELTQINSIMISSDKALLVILLSDAKGQNLDELVNVRRLSLSQKYPDYQELSVEKITLSDGTPAIAVFDKYSSADATSPRIGMRVLAVNSNRYMLINAVTNNDADWPQYGAIIGIIVESISFSASK